MKKSVVVLLVILAVVVIVSPGIVGRLAEKSVDENLNWAAAESGDLVISSDRFDRGWFSSEGQHRVEVKGGNLEAMLLELSPPGGRLPVLVINTHLDHGLIPVSSISRENGSLVPGLGNAVSTLSLEFDSGETLEIPGKIYSNVGLGGEIKSSYRLEAGSRNVSGAQAAWAASNIDVTTNAVSGNVDFSGDIRDVSFSGGSEKLDIEALTFSGSQAPTKFGFYAGDVKLALNGMSFGLGNAGSGRIKRMEVDGFTKVDDGRVSGRTIVALESDNLPQVGEIAIAADISLDGADAEALGALTRKIDALGPAADEAQAFAAMEGELKRLLAAGVEMRFDRLDVTLPMGTVKTRMQVTVPEDDAPVFEWTSLLLSTEASADVSIPAALVDVALAQNPEAGAIVGTGFLQKNGDSYEISAEYKKALLTINGQPMPIPIGNF